MTKLTDAQLVALFKSGNNEAFEEIVIRYQSRIYGYILSLTKDTEISNDILQEVFIKVFKKLNSYDEQNKLLNWLYTLTRNLTMDYFRTNKKNFVPIETQDDEDTSLINVLQDETPGPIEQAIESDKSQIIQNALMQLSTDERELILLKDTMTFKEISQMQNKPIGTLLSKFNRALTKLKKILLETQPEVYYEYMR